MKTLAFVLALLLPAALLAQERTMVPRTAVFQWQPVTLDVEGNPETIGSYAIEAFPADTVWPPVSGTQNLARLVVAGNVTEAAAYLLLAAVATGTNVRIGVRCYDAAGNVSEWSDPLDVGIDWVKPGKVKWKTPPWKW